MTVFRKLLPVEAGSYTAHLLRLPPDGRRSRFMGALSDDAVIRHGQALEWSSAVLVGCFFRGWLRGATELRWDHGLWPDAAELAVSVEPAFQGRGIGRALARRILVVARNRCVREIRLCGMADNRRMRSIGLALGAAEELDGGAFSQTIAVPPPDPFTVALEALDDGSGVAGAVFDQLVGDGAFA